MNLEDVIVSLDPSGGPLAASRPARPERPIILAVDQQLREGPTLRVAPERADPVGPVEVGEHQDVERLGTWSRPGRVQTLQESAL
jgi:hypothetical protein